MRDTNTYFVADKMSFDNTHDHTITNRYPNEYLNSLNTFGLPPFKLDLKVGCPIILLRNITPKVGLCNGTQLMIVKCANRIIIGICVTINKSQGQSVNFVGIDLRIPFFSHGQLYIVLSRCTYGDHTSVLSNDASRSTTNIVYLEILL
ncbi:hypothetical protein RHMOL_Rhmol05G0219300 [Rhododendron molle]|uniref:Uncharacterized protein n=1 Tax=Rhododendron molle TaxID=49168 RepID=A0ACC0NRW2_RHOML|nr:hypothetical protein RHMOL_Rhmol05G0219300 [Rhododendron molle]